MRKLTIRALSAAYGACALVAFTAIFLVAVLLALVVPSLDWRRRTTHALARIAIAVLGLRVVVRGADRLPDGACVVVANHSSYLDGPLLKACLPPRFSFVIKREAAATPVLGFLLHRIGSEFVDRSSRGGRQRDARRVIERAQQGQSLVFFPEGTFDEVPGLKRFHSGAFTAAVRGGMPVVPVAIRGARQALPNRAVLVRPGRIEVEIMAPLPSDGPDATVDGLREQARARIAARLPEPDLAAAARD
ncbi:MAG: lysophospholipid acyltransferase family protein [Steroidobacteraceae bacterium]